VLQRKGEKGNDLSLEEKIGGESNQKTQKWGGKVRTRGRKASGKRKGRGKLRVFYFFRR